MKLIERDWDQLTPMQQAVLDRDTNYDEHYRHMFGLDEGDRVRFVLREDQNTVVEGTYQDRRFVTDNGQRFRQQDLDQTAGFIAVGKTSPEAQQAEAAERLQRAKLRTVSELIPGEVLQEDVEGFGYAGDIVRSYELGRGRDRSTFAVSPDTGRARVMELDARTPYHGRHWQTHPATMLSDAEKRAVFGGQYLDTTVGQLRPGDRVVSTELDDRAAVKETVTVLKVSGNDRKDLTYRDSNDVVQASKKMDTTTVRVHDRSKGALTSLELLQLTGHTNADTEMDIAELADTLHPGQDVFVEMDSYQPFNGSGFSGSIPAKVVEVQHAESSSEADQATLQTTDGEHMTVYSHHSDYSVVPTSRQVSLDELLPTAQAHSEPAPTMSGHVPAASS